MEKSIYSAENEVLTKLLRLARHEAELNQKQLAKRLEQGQSYVSRYERGQKRLSLVELKRICDALDVELIEFIQKWEAAVRKNAIGLKGK